MPENTALAYACRHCKKPLHGPLRLILHNEWSAQDGQPFPLGVKWLPTEQAYNFAIYSLHAHSVELVLSVSAQKVPVMSA
jgi:hypothetical protein